MDSRSDSLSPSVNGAGGHGRATVLVVDDDPGIRAFISTLLDGEGYRVVVAEDGRHALACVAEQRPDVILLDLAMPVMNGWEFHNALRGMALSIPVIFMSAGYNARSEAEAYGAAGFLSKPFEVDDLLHVVAVHAEPVPG
ncbi:MAG: response regulator [Dehalococcoidia bacterium]